MSQGVIGKMAATFWSSLQEDCHQKIDELFSGKLYLIGIAAIVVAVIMVSTRASVWWVGAIPPKVLGADNAPPSCRSSR